MRKVHSNLQDLSLLFSPDEIGHNGNQQVLERLLQLPQMEPKAVMLRWANHLLRSFNELKLVFELETKFKQKFTKEKCEEETKSPVSKML